MAFVAFLAFMLFFIAFLAFIALIAFMAGLPGSGNPAEGDEDNPHRVLALEPRSNCPLETKQVQTIAFQDQLHASSLVELFCLGVEGCAFLEGSEASEMVAKVALVLPTGQG